MQIFHSSVCEINVPVISHRASVRSAKDKLRRIPKAQRKGCLAVVHNDCFRLLLAADLITAVDEKFVEDLPLHPWIYKLSEGRPDCRPLYATGASNWLRNLFERKRARFLYFGTTQEGLALLATIYAEEYSRLHCPPADCYCPQCKKPYSLMDVGDGSSSLCDICRTSISCL